MRNQMMTGYLQLRILLLFVVTINATPGQVQGFIMVAMLLYKLFFLRSLVLLLCYNYSSYNNIIHYYSYSIEIISGSNPSLIYNPCSDDLVMMYSSHWPWLAD